jgi:hypothetical protein
MTAALLVLTLLQAHAQAPMPAHHGAETLFLAQATGKKTVPASASLATATGAFVLDRKARALDYDLTFHGLEHGPPQSIGLYNFGEGGNGKLILALCAGAERPCPKETSANLTGRWKDVADTPLGKTFLAELASARIYLQLIGGNGQPEIRAQLEPNGAMVPVRNFLAHLGPAPEVESRGVGTAVLSEVHFPDGRVSVLYDVTVAGTSGPLRGATLIGVPKPAAVAPTTEVPTLKSLTQRALPRQIFLPTRGSAAGGTLTGAYETQRAQPDAIFVTKFLSTATPQAGIAVATAQYPEGELFGVFKPIR